MNLILLFFSLFSPCETELLGHWELHSWTSTREDGDQFFPYGEDSFGSLSYDEDGTMSLILMKKGRSKKTDEGFFSYSADYTVDCRTHSVYHKVLASSHPDWIGKTQLRFFMLKGDSLILRSPEIKTAVSENKPATHRLVWVRKSKSSD